MRCVHCGKEIRENVIFCIYCDKPVKKEYNHYTCEIYGKSSIFDSNHAFDRTDKKSIYDKIENKTKHKTESKTKNKTENETESKTKNKTENKTKQIRTRTKPKIYDGKEPDNALGKGKIIGVVVTIAVFVMSMVPDTIFNIFSDAVPAPTQELPFIEVYEDMGEYEFPVNPTLNDVICDAVNSCEFGSEQLIIEYLNMLYDNASQPYWRDLPIHNPEELAPYMAEISNIEVDYPNNNNYILYDRLIYIKNFWNENILPIYENPDAFQDGEASEYFDYFRNELISTCQFYLYDEV